MRAEFEIVANNKDITPLIRDRLIELRVVDKPGMDSDEVEIKLDDRDSKVIFPPKGATLRVSLGWSGQRLNYLGTFVVDEVELSGPPSSISVKGKPADLRQVSRGQRDQSYENTTLEDIVKTVAARNGWQPVCKVDAVVPRIDQLGESDIHFMTRIARQYGATASVKDGKLLVMPRDGGVSASGGALPSVSLSPADLISWKLTFPDRSGFKKIKTKSHNKKNGGQLDVIVPNDDADESGVSGTHVDKHVYPSPEAAAAAAKSRKETLNRQTASGSMTMVGRADVAAEKHIVLKGFKAGADGKFLIDGVTHTYNGGSWVTDVSINAGNGGKSKVGKKGGGAIVVPTE